MLAEGVKPDLSAYSWALRACASLKTIEYGRELHSQVIEDSYHMTAMVGGSLIYMYSRYGFLNEACKVFSYISDRNVIAWGVMMTEYIQHGCWFEVFELYKCMQKQSIIPDRVIFLSLLKACSSLKAIREGRLLHYNIIVAVLDLDLAIGSTLVDMYSKFGSLDEAQGIFDRMPVKNIVPWNALMAGYVQNGNGFITLYLHERMQQEGFRPSKATFLCIARACGTVKSLRLAKQTHAILLENGAALIATLGNSLLDMYAKCGSTDNARKIFDQLTIRDDVSWSAMIAGYVHNGYYSSAFQLFMLKAKHGIEADAFLFSIMLKACGSIQRIDHGKVLHDEVRKNGLEFDVVVGNALIDMYCKCGCLTDAREVFNNLPKPSEVSWGAMISGYALHGDGVSALEVFDKMLYEGIIPSTSILPSVVKACGVMKSLDCGHQVYDIHVRSESNLDFVIGNALVDMYIKCESLEEAHKVFDSLPTRDVVSWSTIIAGYVQNGQGIPALQLYIRSQKEGVTPDRVLILCALKASGSVGSAEMGKILHDRIIRGNLETDLAIGNTLLDMYTKCRCLDEAIDVFDKLADKNVVSWNAMIAGLAQHGLCTCAIDCFGNMLCEDIEPDSWTFSGLLSACSEGALIKEGYLFFKSMKEYYNITPDVEHYNCLIDVFGRAGEIKEAKKVLKSMPALPDITTWMSMLTASRIYGYVDLGVKCFDEVAQLEPDAAAVYALLSHMYADFNLLQDAWNVQELKKCSSAWKKPGKAYIEIGDSVKEFTVGEKTDGEIDQQSRLLARHLRGQGYFPSLDLMFESTETELGSSSPQ
ncbi:hypothetical protein KP509_09G059800 [Ceratopteris richardii]|nr:hypothetical protein KP509_09G059800 [Ceratopteris richardii]